MDSVLAYVLLAAVVLVIAVVLGVGLLRRGQANKPARPVEPEARRAPLVSPAPAESAVPVAVEPAGAMPAPEVPAGAEALTPEPVEPVAIEDVDLAVLEVEVPEAATGRMHRLRARLARSNSTLGKGLLALLGSGSIDQSTWDGIEETLLLADLGIGPTTELMDGLRADVAAMGGTVAPDEAKAALRAGLLRLVDPDMDRRLTTQVEGRPAVLLVVGVNGTGKTTTTGKLARLLVAEDRTVVLGAADTFRAAAADQLQTWGDRVGAAVVRGPEGGDPASVAFDAVRIGIESEVDTVVIDTAGRLHTKTGLMDELGKVKRVIEKQSPVDEVLLVIDATTGQNGLVQARVFAEVVEVTGIVLTKLDGTARGGIVVAVQRELGVPVKLVGLGEGPDDLAPFEAAEFVDALLA